MILFRLHDNRNTNKQFIYMSCEKSVPRKSIIEFKIIIYATDFCYAFQGKSTQYNIRKRLIARESLVIDILSTFAINIIVNYNCTTCINFDFINAITLFVSLLLCGARECSARLWFTLVPLHSFLRFILPFAPRRELNSHIRLHFIVFIVATCIALSFPVIFRYFGALQLAILQRDVSGVQVIPCAILTKYKQNKYDVWKRNSSVRCACFLLLYVALHKRDNCCRSEKFRSQFYSYSIYLRT